MGGIVPHSGVIATKVAPLPGGEDTDCTSASGRLANPGVEPLTLGKSGATYSCGMYEGMASSTLRAAAAPPCGASELPQPVSSAGTPATAAPAATMPRKDLRSTGTSATRLALRRCVVVFISALHSLVETHDCEETAVRGGTPAWCSGPISSDQTTGWLG